MITESYCNDIDNISKSMVEFADNSEQVQDAMNNIKEAIAAVNIAVSEITQGVSNATSSAVGMASSMASIQGEATKNLDISNELYNEVRKFKL